MVDWDAVVGTSVGEENTAVGGGKTSVVGENDLEQIIKGPTITISLEHKIQQMWFYIIYNFKKTVIYTHNLHTVYDFVPFWRLFITS